MLFLGPPQLMAAIMALGHDRFYSHGLPGEAGGKSLSLPMGMLSITVSLGKQSLKDAA
jgi:hypothetical protein